ncbi:MAG: proton-conducting transporter membrane subunit [Vicinamibacterales bacterium]
MNVLLPAMVVLPVMAAGISMALWRHVRLQQILGVLVLSAGLAGAIVTIAETAAAGPIAVDMGGWHAPVGITLVADLFSALLLAISLATVLAVFVFAIGQPRHDKSAYYFHPLFLLLTAGVSASFLTGDLFNLFVAFEVMLSVSYVLLTLGGRRTQIRSGMTYVVINLTASTLLVTAVGLVYAATGTLNMADVALRMEGLPPALRDSLGTLLFVTFGIKAAIFPLFFWLPDSYPTAPVTVTAVFAGLLTKVGVYAIIRTQTLIFPGDELTGTFILAVAALTMVVGVFGAIAQDDIKRILSFHIVSQIGYMLFGLGLHSVAGVAAGIFYMIHHIPVKTALFLVSGLIEMMTGTAALHRLGGLIRRSPVTAVVFLVPAMSLGGIPPLSGFFGKLLLLQAGLSAGAWLVSGISLAVGLLTLFSMTKIWAGVFWGAPDEEPPLESARGTGPLRAPALTQAATIALVSISILVGLFAGPIWTLCERAAGELLNRDVYISTVLRR